MTTIYKVLFPCFAAAILAVGCGPTSPTPFSEVSNSNLSTMPTASEILLSERPENAMPVADARRIVTDGQVVALLGRIGGGATPWVEGRAAFTIVDPKLEPCQPGEGCPTPWDYCCVTDQIPVNRAMVKIVDAAGETMPQDARQWLGLKELQTVIVKGAAKRDEAGNLTVLATGVFVVPKQK